MLSMAIVLDYTVHTAPPEDAFNGASGEKWCPLSLSLFLECTEPRFIEGESLMILKVSEDKEEMWLSCLCPSELRLLYLDSR